jgi:endo-1,4-beta-xylanase
MLKKKRRTMVGRRKFLLGLGLLAGISPQISNPLFCKVQASLSEWVNRDFSVSRQAPLHDQAAAKGLIYGAFPSTSYDRLSQLDPELRSALLQECGLLVGGFFWSVIRPSANTFHFDEADSFVQFASNNGILFRGVPLVWNQLHPAWLVDTFKDSATTAKDVEYILIHHISTVAQRYAGQVHSWDVVNEAVWPQDDQPKGLRFTPWLQFLGSDYIDMAFHAARQADPQALLVYNGDRLDHDTPEDEARRVATFNLLADMKSKGTPVQALGIQAHLQAHIPFNLERLRAFLRDVAGLGLKILITELDVSDSQLPADLSSRDAIVAGIYEDYLSVVLDEPAVIAVLTWGLSDRYTWLSQEAPRPDNLPVRPLPFDENLQRKLAWNAIARSFDSAPKR